MTVAQAILDWLKSTNVVAVTWVPALVEPSCDAEPVTRSTTSNEGRIKEQLEVFSDKFPLLTGAEVKEYELAAPGWKPSA